MSAAADFAQSKLHFYVKQLYPPMHDREVVRIVARPLGYPTHQQTVQRFCARHAGPASERWPCRPLARSPTHSRRAGLSSGGGTQGGTNTVARAVSPGRGPLWIRSSRSWRALGSLASKTSGRGRQTTPRTRYPCQGSRRCGTSNASPPARGACGSLVSWSPDGKIRRPVRRRGDGPWRRIGQATGPRVPGPARALTPSRIPPPRTCAIARSIARIWG